MQSFSKILHCLKTGTVHVQYLRNYLVSGVHNAKAEECTTPRIGSRNIEINIGGGGLPRNQGSRPLCKPFAPSRLRSVGIHQEWQQVTGKLLAHSIPSLFWRDYF